MKTRRNKRLRNRSLYRLYQQDLRAYHKREEERWSRYTIIDNEEVKSLMSPKKKEENSTDFTIQELAPPAFELPKLEEVIDQEVRIISVEFDISNFGEYCVLEFEEQGLHVTTGEFVIKQLKRAIKSMTNKGVRLSQVNAILGTIAQKESKDGKYYFLK